MSAVKTIREKIDVLRGRSPVEVVGIFFRKLVYRKVLMNRYAIRAGDSTPVPGSMDLEIKFLRGPAFRSILGTSPNLSAHDIEVFSASDSTCIVAYDGDRVAASSWMTRGPIFVHELQREVGAGEDQHYSCRSYVDPEYRGRKLLGRLVHAYATEVAEPDDELWGVVYEWNVASSRSLERVGWRRTGELGTVTVFGQRIPLARPTGRGGVAL